LDVERYQQTPIFRIRGPMGPGDKRRDDNLMAGMTR
jgi:hypothetical protein